MSSAKFVIVCCLLFIISVGCVEEIERTKDQCVDNMVDWCNDIKSTSGVIIISSFYGSYVNGVSKSYEVTCKKDAQGANCTRDGLPWFRCDPSGVLTYKGVELKKGSTEGVDDEVCETKHGVDKLGFKFNKTAFDASMDSFRERMDRFNQNMNNFGNQMRQMTSNMFGGSWPFSKRPSVQYGTDDDAMK